MKKLLDDQWSSITTNVKAVYHISNIMSIQSFTKEGIDLKLDAYWKYLLCSIFVHTAFLLCLCGRFLVESAVSTVEIIFKQVKNMSTSEYLHERTMKHAGCWQNIRKLLTSQSVYRLRLPRMKEDYVHCLLLCTSQRRCSTEDTGDINQVFVTTQKSFINLADNETTQCRVFLSCEQVSMDMTWVHYGFQ